MFTRFFRHEAKRSNRELIVGVWAVEGARDPRDSGSQAVYGADGSVRLGMGRGAGLVLPGTYRFVDEETVEIFVGSAPTPDMMAAIAAIQRGLGGGVQVRPANVRRLKVSIEGDVLTTTHVESGRVGKFRRVK